MTDNDVEVARSAMNRAAVQLDAMRNSSAVVVWLGALTLLIGCVWALIAGMTMLSDQQLNWMSILCFMLLILIGLAMLMWDSASLRDAEDDLQVATAAYHDLLPTGDDRWATSTPARMRSDSLNTDG